MTNVDKSYRMGIEFNGGWKITENFRWDVNASLSRNRIKDFVAYIDNWSPPYTQIQEVIGDTDLSFSPSLVAGSNFEFEPLENLKFNFTSKYVGRQYTDNSSNKDRSIDPYFINDFNVNYSFTTDLFKEVVLRLMVNNIFDVKYETNAWVYRYYYDGTPGVIDGYYPQAGINYMVGLTLKF